MFWAALVSETENNSAYYIIDLVCVGVVIVLALVDAKRGAIRAVFGLFSTAVALWAAYAFAASAAEVLDALFRLGEKVGENICRLIGGVCVFVLLKLAMMLLGKVLTKIANAIPFVGGLNTLLGAVAGLCKAAFLICAVLAVLSVLPETISFMPKINSALDQTLFVYAVRDNNPLLTVLRQLLDKTVDGEGASLCALSSAYAFSMTAI